MNNFKHDKFESGLMNKIEFFHTVYNLQFISFILIDCKGRM